MTQQKALRIEFLRTGPRIHSWRRIAEIICEEFPEENQALSGNQLHGIDLCREAMVFLSGVASIKEVSPEIRDKWDT